MTVTITTKVEKLIFVLKDLELEPSQILSKEANIYPKVSKFNMYLGILTRIAQPSVRSKSRKFT